jgi:hypothetical protein
MQTNDGFRKGSIHPAELRIAPLDIIAGCGQHSRAPKHRSRFAMFFQRTNVKSDPVQRWHRPDRHFFANGACQVLAHVFLEIYPDLDFRARWIKPASGQIGNNIYVTDGVLAFDYHGLTTEQRLLSLAFRRGRRFFPGWDATLPADVLVSEAKSRTYEGLWLREPNRFLHDAMPRARAFVQRFGDLRSDIMDLRDRLNAQQAQDELNEVKPIIDTSVDGTMMGFAGARPILCTESR